MRKKSKNPLGQLWPFGGRTKARSIPTHVEMMENLEDRMLMSAAPQFVAMIDGTQSSWSNTGRSIVFYDVSGVPNNSGQSNLFNQTPMFSVWLGYEEIGTRNQEELQAVAINPFNGDAYVLAFDSGTPGTVEFNDTNGDYDLYHINFAAIYSDFITNHRAKGTMYAPALTAQGFNYYDEYGSVSGNASKPAVDNVSGSGDFGVPTGRSNTDGNTTNDIVFINGVISKVGEVARAGASGTTPFFDQQTLEFIDSDTLLLIENTTAATNNATGPLNQDYSIRTIERISTSPGAATTGANSTGGYNKGTTESWGAVAWSGNNFVDMDNNAATGSISDVDGIRYVERDGIRGVWVSDRDGGGDDLSFFYLDFNTHTVQKAQMRYQNPNGEGYVYAPSFALDNDPAAGDNQGNINWFNIDENGNLVISESGFTDSPQTESSIIRREIRNYNVGDSNGDGILELTFGASTLSAKLAPTLTDDAGPVNGSYGVYVAGQNLVYYFDADASGPGVVGDVYVVDATTGAVVYQELDAANHFFRDANSIRSFTLPQAAVAPKLLSTKVGDGSAQRSSVSSFTLTFDSAVNLTANSFSMLQYATDASGNMTGSSTDVSAHFTFATIDGGFTWTISVVATTSGGSLDRTSTGKSLLKDGIYQLVLHGSAITDAATGTAQFNDGADQVAKFSSAGHPESDFVAVLYGDYDGNGVVNNADYARFRVSNGTADAIFDYDGNGVVNNADYARFRANNGARLIYV